MNIAYIYEDGFMNNNGSNHLHASIIHEMLDRGNTVHLFQGSKNQDVEEYPKQLKHDNFYCHTIYLKNVEKTNFIGRYLNGLKFCKRCKKLYKKMNVDLFFIQSSPTVSFAIKKAYGCNKNIIYNIYDVFPGSAYELGIIKNKLLDIVFKAIQKIGYKKARKIIVMSDDMMEKIVEQNVDKSKIFVVHNWFDNTSVKKVLYDENEFVRENNIDCSKLIVQYAGNVGQVFGLNEFTKLVHLLKDNENIEFHVIGEGVKLQLLKENLKDCTNIRFFGWQPQNKMGEIYSYCDLEIIPLHQGVIGNNVPSKVALSLSCGKPVINIVEDSHYSKNIVDAKIGFSYSQSDIVEAAKTLDELSKDKNILKEYENRCIDYAKSNYSKDKNIDLLLKYCFE